MDEIALTTPAAPENVRLIRLVAAGLASRLEFTIDEIDDLKIAVDEMCSYLTGSDGSPGEIEVVFRVADDGIEVKGRGQKTPARPKLSELSRQILLTVADEATLDEEDSMRRFSIVKKRRGAGEPD